MTRADHKRSILLALSMIIGKDDDLMPDEIDPDSAEGRRWQAARDELVAEFDRRAAADQPAKMDLTPEPCECHGDPYCEDDK